MKFSSLTVQIALAFLGVYLIWGTTYLAIAYAIETVPPFLTAGVRYVAGGVMMYLWLRRNDAQPFRGLDYKTTILCGFLMPTMGNGLVVWAQQGVPSGLAALVVASVPILVLVFDWLFFSKRAPTATAGLGIAVALAGVVTIIAHAKSLSGHARPAHLIALILAVGAWSMGSLVQRRSFVPGKILNVSCLQMLSGGVFLLLFATLNGEWQRLDLHRISLASMLAVAYLSVFGSVIAMTCYLWLLSHVPPQKATTYALVNPVVAIVLGGWLLHERITPLVVFSAVGVLLGVSIVLFMPSLSSRVRAPRRAVTAEADH